MPAVVGLGMLVVGEDDRGSEPDTSMSAPLRRAVTGERHRLRDAAQREVAGGLGVICVLSGGNEPKSIGWVSLNVAVGNRLVSMMRPVELVVARDSSLLTVVMSTVNEPLVTVVPVIARSR